MLSLIRRFTVLTLLAGLLAPATSAVCGAFAGDHCSPASQHGCCKGARVSQCDCEMDGAANHQSEPARRTTAPGPDLAVAAIGGELLPATIASDVRVRPHRAPPPLHSSDRLTLLSTLLV